nr:hypothetical protein Iba_chr11eCG15970 [Ipomoea batatas]
MKRFIRLHMNLMEGDRCPVRSITKRNPICKTQRALLKKQTAHNRSLLCRKQRQNALNSNLHIDHEFENFST